MPMIPTQNSNQTQVYKHAGMSVKLTCRFHIQAPCVIRHVRIFACRIRTVLALAQHFTVRSLGRFIGQSDGTPDRLRVVGHLEYMSPTGRFHCPGCCTRPYTSFMCFPGVLNRSLFWLSTQSGDPQGPNLNNIASRVNRGLRTFHNLKKIQVGKMF